MPLSGLAASRKQPKQLVAGSPTFRQMLALTGCVFSLPSAQALAAAGPYEPAHEALREALNIASQLSDPKLEARLLGARSTSKFPLLSVERGCRRRFAANNWADQKRLPGSAPYSCEFCIRHCCILDAWKRR